MKPNPPRRFRLPPEPTTDKHEQRIEVEPEIPIDLYLYWMFLGALAWIALWVLWEWVT